MSRERVAADTSFKVHREFDPFLVRMALNAEDGPEDSVAGNDAGMDHLQRRVGPNIAGRRVTPGERSTLGRQAPSRQPFIGIVPYYDVGKSRSD